MPAGSARPNGEKKRHREPFCPRLGEAEAVVSVVPVLDGRVSLETLASTNSLAWKSCAATRAASRKRNVASGVNAAGETFETCFSVPSATAATTPSAYHTFAMMHQSITQHPTMTRRNARAEPHVAASRH